MASAVQTYCGQTYGAKRYNAMGIIFQKALILHLGAAVILSFLYWYCGPILKAMGQAEEIAQEGQTFAHGLIPQLYALALSYPMQRFLQAQNIVNPLAYMVFGVFCLHILLNWVVIYVLGYGVFEAALTLSFSWWVFALMNGLYILLSPSCKESWTGFSRRAFIGIWPYFKITIASAVMLWYASLSFTYLSTIHFVNDNNIIHGHSFIKNTFGLTKVNASDSKFGPYISIFVDLNTSYKKD